MPLLDITISQPRSCFGNNVAFRSQTLFHKKLLIGNDRGLGLTSAFSRETFGGTPKFRKQISVSRVEVWQSGLMIKAVATLETTSLTNKTEGVKGHQNELRVDVDPVRPNPDDLEAQSSSEDSTEVGEREKLRRMRISQANKGNTPWNKGKKHSPETLQRIKERTRLAMQNPKVKMKLVNLGHAQSEETRMKIGIGVRLGWEKRRETLMLQETCHYEWQNLIAGAARKGLLGEEELQWDSYKILSEQLEQEWLQSVEQRKNMLRPKGSKRAPKSAEQKRKISEAIAAKWADPEYRNRVCSGLAQYHGIPEGAERRPRRKPSPSGDGQTRQRSSKKKDETDDHPKREFKSQAQPVRSKRSKAPSYKDPLASFKLEILKKIRAQRAAAMNKKSEAITRAKLMIAEAEEAAEALEIAARQSPLAQSSLMESRKLIAEAIQVIKSIENEHTIRFEDDEPSEYLTEPVCPVEEELDASTRILHKKINGFHSLSISDKELETDNFTFDKLMLPDLVNGNPSSSGSDDLDETGEKLNHTSSDGFLPLEVDNTVKKSSLAANLADHKPNPNGISVNGLKSQSDNTEAPKRKMSVIKKWVRGKLVEVTEGT